MKEFFKKIIIFLFLVLFTLIFIVIVPSYIIKTQSKFVIDDNITRLVIGHSHSAYSINDSILKKSINLSASGESYFYNYQKLKQVVINNKQLKTVLIEFANNNIDSIMDDWTWGFEKMSHRLHYYAPFMNSEDFKLLLEHNSTDLLTSYSIASRKHFYRIFYNDYNLIDEIGGYKNPKNSKLNDLLSDNNFNSSISKSHSLSEINLIYLRKMITLCRENNIEVFLLRSPQHPLYGDLSNESLYKNVLKTDFKDIELLDFDAMNFPNSHYLDFHHLNYVGAKEFTMLLNNLIENNLLNSSKKQDIINQTIQEFNQKRD